MEDAEQLRELLDERQGLETALEAILEVDAHSDVWSFDDVSVDTGEFGELVNKGIVEQVDDGYRLTSARTVRRALSDTPPAGESEDSSAEPGTLPAVTLPAVDTRTVLALGGALSVILLVRLLSLFAVFRSEAVVLSGNDPYYYRYWVEELARDAGGILDISTLSTLPPAVSNGEPLFVTSMWWVSGLFGGSKQAIGWVLAWYPALSAVATGILVYLLAGRIADDRRVGLAAAIMLAIIPAHLFRTSLGFADHHAFDYLWLAGTALFVVLLMTREQDTHTTRTWGVATLFGLSVAGQTLAWEAGPLLLVPLGVFVVIAVPLALRDDLDPGSVFLPLLAGLTVGTLISAVAHLSLGWHTSLVAYAPMLLLAGSLAVVIAGSLAYRYGLSIRQFVALEAVGGIASVLALSLVAPSYWTSFTSKLSRLVGYSGTIAETTSALEGGGLWFILLIGPPFALALPFMVWGTWHGLQRRSLWLIPAIYSWYFLVLASLQIRFVGEFTLFLAVFAGLGFVWLGHWIDVLEAPTPFVESSGRGPTADTHSLSIPGTRQFALLFALFLLVGGFSLVQGAVKVSQSTVDDDTYQTAIWIAHNADEQSLDYPDNYVFSQWSWNRVYNYFANGQSRSYGYARSHYEPFISATNETEWYRQLRGRVGFIVTENVSAPSATLQARLHERSGGGTAREPGLAHFRTVYVSPDRSHKVSIPVSGATIRGVATPNSTYTVSTPVEIPGSTFTYTRRVRANKTGHYRLTVAYPGTYTVGNQTVRVTTNDVTTGRTLAVSTQP